MGDPGAGERNAGGGVRFGDALRFWAKLGFISFGGPAGQIAILHREVVERRRWISETRFLHALNYCVLLPGPEAQQLATYIGWLLHGVRGGLAAGILFVLPSIFILWGLSYGYAAWGGLPLVAGVMGGFKCVVVAIVVEAVQRIGRRALHRWNHLLVAAGAFVAIHFLQVPFPWIVISAALIGLSGSWIWPAAWAPREAAPPAAGTGPAREAAASPPAIPDDGPPAAHTRPSPGRALRILLIGTALWTIPFLALGAWRGWSAVPLQQYRFFTVAALVTFGGAYAVLAYVNQTAVHTYGWITAVQAVDGLALAETTPGPLIMVLQFVGFITGWNHPEGLGRLAAATLGALVTTWTTFLPCFLFVFVGAPWIERLRGSKALHGALAGVTASVLGVVLNLALVFAGAVILPHGSTAGPDWTSAGLAALAFLLLARFRLDPLWIVLGGGLAGLARTLWSG